MARYEVKFNRNVKLGADIYRKGDTAEVSAEVLDEIKATIEEGYSGTPKTETVEVQDMTIAELKDYAKEQSIDLGEAKKRDDILTAIQAVDLEK